MRIVIPANRLDPAGGLERTQLTNCEGLAGRGHTLDLVYVEPGAFSEEWRAIATTITQVATTLPRRAHPLRSSLNVLDAVRRARRLQPDVVYAYRYWDLPYAVAVASQRRTAVVYHLCLPPPEPVPRWLRPALSRVDATVSVSRHTLGLWEGTGLPTQRATVALTSIDLTRYAPADAATRVRTRADLGLAADDLVVVFAGRISPDKGLDALIEAFRLLTGSCPRSRLVAVGSPSATSAADGRAYYTALQRSAEGLPVTWLPRRADVVPLLQMADVAVVPSRWPEPLSRSVIEPLACGTPVVATNVGGTPEVLTGWLAEYLVSPEDPPALATRLHSVSRWRTDDPGLGGRCRMAAESRLSLSDELDVLEATMVDALGACGGRTAGGGKATGSVVG